VGVLLLFVAAISWLAAAFGLAVSSPEAANGAMFFLMFLSYASSAFVPVRTMPWWLRGFARHQPATPVTETLRGLLLGQPAGGLPAGGLPAGGLPAGGQPAGGQLAAALAWSAGILAASVLLSMVLFRRRTA
jgi:ABC-2 type transport system permease protein